MVSEVEKMKRLTGNIPKPQFIFPIRRTTLPQSEIDILNKKAHELKTYTKNAQIILEKKFK